MGFRDDKKRNFVEFFRRKKRNSACLTRRRRCRINNGISKKEHDDGRKLERESETL
jgi:hypothetical protein